MGCTSSKQARRDRRRSPTTLYDRSYSAPVRRKNSHVVSLTSTTIGYLKLDRSETGASSSDEETMKAINDHAKAKAWSEMIERKFPKTPPNEELETINAWELMAGLDDISPLRPATIIGSVRSLSFNASYNAALPEKPRSPVRNSTDTMVTAARCFSFDGREVTSESTLLSIVSDFDPEVISSFNKALEELSPKRNFLLTSPEKVKKDPVEEESDITPKFSGIVKARVNELQQRINSRRNSSIGNDTKLGRCLRGGENKAVFFFTSLRGIRKTYEDCFTVRMILKGYNVKVDERDVSMHSGFKEELIEALGGGGYSLPKVFVDGMYIGGADEVKAMHEGGELGGVLEGCEMVGVKGGGGQCEGCGDVRFVPCETCSGSCKVYVECEESEEEDEEGDGGFRRCEECNENGLVRCPLCY